MSSEQSRWVAVGRGDVPMNKLKENKGEMDSSEDQKIVWICRHSIKRYGLLPDLAR